MYIFINVYTHSHTHTHTHTYIKKNVHFYRKLQTFTVCIWRVRRKTIGYILDCMGLNTCLHVWFNKCGVN